MWITLSILIIAAIFFMSGKVRSDLVAICSLLLLLIFHILTPEEGLSGFSNSVVIMMIGLFVVGGAIFQTGLAKMISGRLLKLSGKSELRLFLLVMLATAFIGAFVSNTGTVALMLPIVVSMAASAGANVRRLLMPLAFASSMGGMMTLIGTPPNLIIQDALVGAGYEPLSFFSFLPVGLVCLAVGILVLLPATKWFLSGKMADDSRVASRGKSLTQLTREYDLTGNLFRLRVEDGSPVVGRSIAQLDMRREHGVNILEIRREKSHQGPLLHSVTQLYTPDTVLEADDILYVSGDRERVARMASLLHLRLMGDENVAHKGEGLAFYDLGIAEIVLMPSSRMINRTVKEVDFRRSFHVNVLAIRRRQHIGSEKMHSGDVLLVQGSWEDIARLSKEEDNWVVLGQPLDEAAKVTLDYKAPLAAAIMVLMVAMMVFDFFPVEPVTAVMIAAVLMVLTGCLRSVEAAYKTINWERRAHGADGMLA